MNNFTLLFKIKKSTNLQTVISNSNQELITFDELDRVDYSPNTLIEKDQCYQITGFSERNFCPDFLKRTFGSVGYSQWEKSNIKIDYILNTDGEKFYFQKFVPSQFVKKTFLAIDEPRFINDKIIAINKYATAYYNRADDVLLFKKFEDLKKIFAGIEELYREATQQEIDTFLSNSLFNIKSYDKNKMGSMNRKRIALLKERV